MPFSTRVLGGVAPLIAGLGLLAFSGSAVAQAGNPFGCTADTAGVTAGGTQLLAPGRANAADTPCASDTATVGSVAPLSGSPLGISLGPVDAQTTLSTDSLNGSTVYTEARAQSTVDALSVVGPSGASIGVTTPSTAVVDYRCENNALVPSSGSTLRTITISGVPTPLTGLPQTLNVPGVGTVNVNQHAATGSPGTASESDTETLISINLLPTVGGGGTITAGQATASLTQAGGCAGTGAGSGAGSGGPGGPGGSGGSGGSTGAPVNVAMGASGGGARVASGPGAPTISGRAAIGDVLTAHNGTWTGAAPLTFTYQWRRNGKAIPGATGPHYRVRPADAGHYLDLEVTAHNRDGSTSVLTRRIFIPFPAGCPAAVGRVTATGIGRVTLGLAPRQARTAYSKSRRRHVQRYEDYFCFTPNGIRVGYASPKALIGVGRSMRNALAGRVIWISTANRHYVAGGIRPGARLTTARQRLHLGRGYRVGTNVWYFGHIGHTELLLKAPHRTVEEIGIVNGSLTRTNAQRRRFLNSFSIR